ncbi:MAG: hypothetical protein WAM14_22220 [Candidatus Nitrosopolaris sp.]
MFGQTHLEYEQELEEKAQANIMRLAKEGETELSTLQIWLDKMRGEVRNSEEKRDRREALQEVNEMITLILYTRKAMELSSFLETRIIVKDKNALTDREALEELSQMALKLRNADAGKATT